MNCLKCGTPLRGTEKFCRNCGTPVNKNEQIEINNGTNSQYISRQQFEHYNMNNNYNNYSNIPKANKIKYFIMGFLLAIGLLILLFFMIGILANDNLEKSENSNLNDQPSTILPDDFYYDNSTHKVEYQGFTFNIPSNLDYKIEDESLYISDELDTWAVYLSIGEGSYSKILDNKDYLPSFFEEKEFYTSEALETTIDNTKFITMEFTYNNYNGIIAYTAANSMYVFGLTVYSYDNDYNYNIIEKINPILKNAQFNNKNDDVSALNGLSLSIISQLGR